jgi:hypothetical protein
MDNFEKKLENLLIERKKKKKSDLKDFDYEIVVLIGKHLTEIDEVAPFMAVIEKYMKNHYHIASKGIASGFSRFSDDKKKLFKESFLSAYEKSLTYQFISRLLEIGLTEEAMELLSYCCEMITNDGEKPPTKDLQKKLNAALLLIPELKEKPMRMVLEHAELSKNILISIMAVLMETKGNDKNKGKNLIFYEKLILHASKIWEKLSGNERDNYDNCISQYLAGKNVSDFLINVESKKNLSDDFIKEFFPEKAEVINDDVNKSIISDEIDSESTDDKPTENIIKTPFTPSQSSINDSKKESLIDALHAMEEILSWVTDSPIRESRKLLEKLEDLEENENNWTKKINVLKNENNSLKEDLKELNSKNILLEDKYQVIQSEIEQKNNKIIGLQNELKLLNESNQNKISEVVKESEARESRAIYEFKNQIASRIQPIIDDFYSLNSKTDFKEKSEGQYKIFNHIITTFQEVLNIKVLKNE